MFGCCFHFSVVLLRSCYVVASFAVWGCYAHATLLLPLHCVGLLRLCYVVASFSLCGVVTLMLRCCFLFTVWGCYAYATLLLPFHCVGLLRLCYVVASSSLCGVVTLMLRCCFLFTEGLLRLCYAVASFSLWGCYAYATLLLPFHCVGLIRLCYVVTSFSLCGVVTLMLRCYFLFAVALANFALQEMQDDPGEQLKKMLRRRHDGPNIFLQETTPILILLLCATIFDK